MAATATLAGYNTLAGSNDFQNIISSQVAVYNDLALAVWLDEVVVFKTGRGGLIMSKLRILDGLW